VTETEALYRRIIDAINEGDENGVRQLLSDGLVDHNPIPDQSPGAEGFLEWMRSARGSFPDLRGRIEELLLDGDKVVGRVNWEGTHRGTFLGVPPTNRPISFQAIHIVRISRGRAAEWWGVADFLTALDQVGAEVRPPSEPSSKR
jgi:steroid delta-isomerase-like uncharacterized protein